MYSEDPGCRAGDHLSMPKSRQFGETMMAKVGPIATTTVVVALLDDGNLPRSEFCLAVIVRGMSDRAGSTFGRWGLIGRKEDGGFLFMQDRGRLGHQP